MRLLVFAAVVMLSCPVFAQPIAPLAIDGRVACVQGMTGIGRPPSWKAIADPDALGGWAISETTGDTTDLHFPLCISTQTEALDIDATLRFKPISGTAARTAGIVLRAQNANDYYVVAANALDGSVRLYRMQGGRRAQLAVKDTPIATGQWHDLRVVLVGNDFRVSLDRTELFKATDRSLPLPGAVGVWSQSDSVVRFGSLVVGAPS
ncbi:Laminin G domain [Enhydrobacter aerosaccus]|uniref:Laminin G domain n=1 Tax=Enhydrobacter aerosaccus TaxID=225324 RepID=A0A1T4TFZ5_9HYPH|nr:LamG domain-containing protein [Enhydrobacter aerosaccus]SKA39228.1 Laminin G domain [Enhydrobacter aerosaccus]